MIALALALMLGGCALCPRYECLTSTTKGGAMVTICGPYDEEPNAGIR